MFNKEKIVIIGYGWVGQANALALTIMGYPVFYFDVVKPRLHYLDGYSHIYEKIKPLGAPLEKDGPETWYLISVGDRVAEDGQQDISLIKRADDLVKGARGGILLRSTVLPQNLSKLDFDFYVPEFLHEKHAVEECINPFYFVVGKNSDRPEPGFFKEWADRSHKIFKGTPEQASYIKYLSNIWNALRIAFVNEFGSAFRDPKNPDNLKKINEVIDFVFENKNYLKYGKAYGGHCLPKDTLAFFTAHAPQKNIAIVRAVHESNSHHKNIEKRHGDYLPEWFSSWSYEIKLASGRSNPIFNSLRVINALPLVQSGRKRLRFLTRVIQAAMPNQSLSDTRDFWNKLAVENARYFSNPLTPSGKDATEFEVRETGLADYKRHIQGDDLLKKGLDKFRDSIMLDLGCGMGRMTEFMADDFQQVCGVDISDTMIESARKRLAGKNNVELKLAQGNSIPYPNNHFNLVFSYSVFQHFPTEKMIKENLEEIYRVLKPGRIAKIHLRTGLGTYKWHWFYGVAIAPEAAKEMAEKCGFRILKSEVRNVKNLWLILQKA